MKNRKEISKESASIVSDGFKNPKRHTITSMLNLVSRNAKILSEYSQKVVKK